MSNTSKGEERMFSNEFYASILHSDSVYKRSIHSNKTLTSKVTTIISMYFETSAPFAIVVVLC